VAGLAAAVAFVLLAGTVISSYFAVDAVQKATEAATEAKRADEKTTEAAGEAKRADEKAEELRVTLYAADMNQTRTAW
jgi:hypothetical protein